MAPDDHYWDEFEGIDQPHYTQMADEIFNGLLPRLGHAELKVLLLIARKTFGWGKNADAISLGQLVEDTGLNRSSVQRAVKSLEAKGVIQVRRDLTKLGDAAVNTYGLVIRAERQRGRRTKHPPVGAQSTPQDTSLQETNNENERPSVSSQSNQDGKTALIQKLAAELAPGEQPQAIATYLSRFPPALIEQAAEITRKHSNTKKPIAYLYGVVQRLVEQEALQPLAQQKAPKLPELTDEEYQASLQALDRVKQQVEGE